GHDHGADGRPEQREQPEQEGDGQEARHRPARAEGDGHEGTDRVAGDLRPDHAATSFWSMRRRKTVSRSSVSSALAMSVRPAFTANSVISRWTAAEAPALVTTS